MSKPEFEYIEGIFGIQRATVVCVANTIKFDDEIKNVFFDGICKDGTYRFSAKIGKYEDGTEFMPNHKWWCDLLESCKNRTLTINYAWLDKEPIALWVE